MKLVPVLGMDFCLCPATPPRSVRLACLGWAVLLVVGTLLAVLGGPVLTVPGG